MRAQLPVHRSVARPHELKAVERHGKMQDALFRADRAVAFADRAKIGPDAEPYSTAMAATMIGFEHRFSSVND